jgi:hypothetical protein
MKGLGLGPIEGPPIWKPHCGIARCINIASAPGDASCSGMRCVGAGIRDHRGKRLRVSEK